MVIYGDLSERDIDCIRTLCAESTLEVPVDVVSYKEITSPALKDHINSVMRPLFTQDALRHS